MENHQHPAAQAAADSDEPPLLLQHHGDQHRWVPHLTASVLGLAVGLAVVGPGGGAWGWGLGVGLFVAVIVWGPLRVFMEPRAPHLEIDFPAEELTIGRRRRVPFAAFVGAATVTRPRTEVGSEVRTVGLALDTATGAEEAAAEAGGEVPRRFTLMHELRMDSGEPFRIVLGGRRAGASQESLVLYARLLEALDFSPRNWVVAGMQSREPDRYGLDADSDHPQAGAWQLAELRRQVDSLRRAGHDGGPVTHQDLGHATLVEHMTEDEHQAWKLRAARQRKLRGRADGAEGRRRERDAVGHQTRAAASTWRRWRRVCGGAAALLLVGASAVLFYATAATTDVAGAVSQSAGLAIGLGWLLILGHGALWDQQIRVQRRTASRLLAPGTDTGQATAGLYSQWWWRVIGSPSKRRVPAGPEPAPEQRNHGPTPIDAHLGLGAREALVASGALAEVVIDSWTDHPRRLLRRLAISGELLAVGVLLLLFASGWWGFLLIAGVLASVSIWWHGRLNRHGPHGSRAEIRHLLDLLERMRTDPAYGAHPLR
ncbi:hypothetical protein GCM10027061_13480 [Nesterenkonia suensis]